MTRSIDPATTERIVEVAHRHLTERGYAEMSIDAIATAADVSRPTVYRRWPTKAHLGFEVMMRDLTAATPPPPGLLVDRLVAANLSVATAMHRLDRTMVADLLAAMARDAGFATEVDERFLSHGVATMRALVDAAAASGEIGEPRHVDDLLESLGGALVYRTFVLHRHLDADDVRRLVTWLVEGALGSSRR